MGLNASKGQMYEWVTHTWNAIKGKCLHDCSYCHPAGTMIMMSNFTQKDIKNVVAGDSIIGIRQKDSMGFYRFTESVVVAISKRKEKTIKITTNDSEIICTKEHPLMGSTETRNCSDWKAARAFSPYEHLRYVSKESRGPYSTEHRLGYIKGIIDGDGCVFNFQNKYKGFEIVCIDEELRNKIREDFIEMLDIRLKDGIKRSNKKSYGSDCPMLHTRVTKEINQLCNMTKFRLNIEFAKGYIAGMLDTDGSIGKNGSIRISQSKTANKVKLKQIKDCCGLLNITFRSEENGVRILGGFKFKIEMLFNYGIYHSVKSRRLLIGNSFKGSTHSKIISIKACQETKVYNLQTECENFIANGFIVHNCYMKRWGELNPIRLDEKEFKTDLGSDNTIFVGSSCDMFAKDIPYEWIIKTIQHIIKFDNTYLFQSKNPKRFDMLATFDVKKYILCTTIETNRVYSEIMRNSPDPVDRAIEFGRIPIKEKYITIEPIMDFDLKSFISMIQICKPLQVNIGADSGKNKLPEPTMEKVMMLIEMLKGFTTIHRKSNLKRLLK